MLLGCTSSQNRILARAGFTLIELMFVVAIVAILLALAYPSYVDQVRKARRADATSTLLAKAQSMERCFTRSLIATRAGDQVNDLCGAFTVDYLSNKTPVPESSRCWGSA